MHPNLYHLNSFLRLQLNKISLEKIPHLTFKIWRLWHNNKSVQSFVPKAYCLFITLLLISIFANKCSVDALSQNPNDVIFYLFPRNRELKRPQVIQYHNESSLQQSSFIRGATTVIILPGVDLVFNPRSTLILIKGYRSSRIKGNYIAVEWIKLSYTTSRDQIPLLYENVAIVGKRVADFIAWLVVQDLVSLSQIHVIGSSLGGQLASVVGRSIQQIMPGKRVERITALDPAYWHSQFAVQNVPKSGNAKFVDVFHSNSGRNGSPVTSKADVHVVLNKGTVQPGCEHRTNDTVNDCSHRWAIYVYAAGLHKVLKACQCPFWKMMRGRCDGNDWPCLEPTMVGPYISERARGTLHLKTEDYSGE